MNNLPISHIYNETLEIDGNWGIDEVNKIFRYSDKTKDVLIRGSQIYSCIVMADLESLVGNYREDVICVMETDELAKKVWESTLILAVNCIDENGEIYTLEKKFAAKDIKKKIFEYSARIEGIISRKKSDFVD